MDVPQKTSTPKAEKETNKTVESSRETVDLTQSTSGSDSSEQVETPITNGHSEGIRKSGRQSVPVSKYGGIPYPTKYKKKPIKKREIVGLWFYILSLKIRNYFFTGIVVLVPIGLTIYLSKFLINTSSKILPSQINPNYYLPFKIFNDFIQVQNCMEFIRTIFRYTTKSTKLYNVCIILYNIWIYKTHQNPSGHLSCHHFSPAAIPSAGRDRSICPSHV